MPSQPPDDAAGSTGVSLAPWANTGFERVDAEIAAIHQMEQRASPIPDVAKSIRELITRLEICHFKVERHLERIVEAIGSMSLDFAPASIGEAHPKCGETAWQKDRTGRSRQGQEYVWVLQMWLAGARLREDDPRQIPQGRFDAVTQALGERDSKKALLVSALVNRLLLKADRQPLPPDLAAFWVPIERMDVCHYAFPNHLQQMIGCIGRMEPPTDYVGCGSFDDRHREMSQKWFCDLCAWLRGEPGRLSNQLGKKTPVKEWLAACLAKTLKELAGLRDNLPLR